MPVREAQKVANEYVAPMNQGLQSIGFATNFAHYVETTYKPIVLPLMSATTRDRYESVIKNYLNPTFGKECLRDLTPMALQAYFSGMVGSPLRMNPKTRSAMYFPAFSVAPLPTDCCLGIRWNT